MVSALVDVDVPVTVALDAVVCLPTALDIFIRQLSKPLK